MEEGGVDSTAPQAVIKCQEPESQGNTSSNDDSKNSHGYDLFPERKGATIKTSWKDIFWSAGPDYERKKCENRVWKVAKSSPMVKIMMSALESSGCPVDLSRHVACEVCETSVTGGYDAQNNQIVVCQNMCKSDSLVNGVLTHEMIHMFDACRHDLDFKNIEHLACTEIRAANLTHCSFITSVSHGASYIGNIARSHEECVKVKASWSVVAAKNVSIEEARKVVDQVYPQCSKDLEPIGRRIRRGSIDPVLALYEKHHYGYW